MPLKRLESRSKVIVSDIRSNLCTAPLSLKVVHVTCCRHRDRPGCVRDRSGLHRSKKDGGQCRAVQIAREERGDQVWDHAYLYGKTLGHRKSPCFVFVPVQIRVLIGPRRRYVATGMFWAYPRLPERPQDWEKHLRRHRRRGQSGWTKRRPVRGYQVPLGGRGTVLGWDHDWSA